MKQKYEPRLYQKRLCPACIHQLEQDHIVRPTREQCQQPHLDVWTPGICERCGRKRSMTKERRYMLSYEGCRERGLV